MFMIVSEMCETAHSVPVTGEKSKIKVTRAPIKSSLNSFNPFLRVWDARHTTCLRATRARFANRIVNGLRVGIASSWDGCVFCGDNQGREQLCFLKICS